MTPRWNLGHTLASATQATARLVWLLGLLVARAAWPASQALQWARLDGPEVGGGVPPDDYQIASRDNPGPPAALDLASSEGRGRFLSDLKLYTVVLVCVIQGCAGESVP